MAVTRPQIQLVLDFDGTITTQDTTAVIGSRCLAKARELAPSGVSQLQLPKAMEYYSEKYLQEYRECKDSFAGSVERKTVEDEISYLSQSRSIEVNSFLRVRDAVLSVPGGINEVEHNETKRHEFMMVAGRHAIRSGEVQVRDPHGLRRLIAKAESEGNVWGVVSVSWSRRFILGVLIEAGLVKHDQAEDMALNIKGNELLSLSSAHDLICSAQDKRDAFHRLLAEWNSAQPHMEGKHLPDLRDETATITIYVGDSTTDIGCIVGPDIGVHLQSQQTPQDPVLETLDRLGIECLSIAELPTGNTSLELHDRIVRLQEQRKPPHLVCLATNFEEIAWWVEKLYHNSTSAVLSRAS